MSVTKLSVNLNKVATLRNTRSVGIPSILRMAELALEGGADGLTVHPRPDRRHILPADVTDLAGLLEGVPDIELNIEGNPFYGLMEHCRLVRPTQATLVPDDPAAFTSDHGWDFRRDAERLGPVVRELQDLGIRVSLFADADPEAMEHAAEIGAERVELYTEPFAATASGSRQRSAALELYARTSDAARNAGMGVNAGHDLNLENLASLIETVRPAEVSIGHALVADALEFGMSETVRRYVETIRAADS